MLRPSRDFEGKLSKVIDIGDLAEQINQDPKCEPHLHILSWVLGQDWGVCLDHILAKRAVLLFGEEETMKARH